MNLLDTTLFHPGQRFAIPAGNVKKKKKHTRIIPSNPRGRARRHRVEEGFFEKLKVFTLQSKNYVVPPRYRFTTK